MKFTRYFTLVLLLSCTFTPPTALAYDLKGHLFEKGTGRKNLLFKWERTEKKGPHGHHILGVFKYPDGKTAVEEETILKDGALHSYTVRQNQTGETFKVEVHDGKLHFSGEKDGKIETNTEDWQPSFLVGPLVVAYLSQHRDLILQGKSLDVRYGALARKETIGFTFQKVEEITKDGVPAVVIKMKASSLFLSAFVEPLYFTLRKSDFRILELLGRTLPYKKEGGEWKDLDCDVVYF